MTKQVIDQGHPMPPGYQYDYETGIWYKVTDDELETDESNK